MRVLVTGGAGFIGSHTVDALLAAGHQVGVIDDLSTGKRENVPAAAEAVYADLSSPEAAAFVVRFRPEAALHLAAKVSVRTSIEDPVHDARTNVLGTLALLEACRQAGTRALVFASTGGAMYGTARTFPIPETTPTEPESPYGCAKLAAEGYLGMYRRVHGMTTCALRYANVYGPRQDPHGEAGVVAIFALRCRAGEPLLIHGDGSQTRDYVHVSDVVAANLAALKAGLEGAYNVGTGVESDVSTVARHLLALSGNKAGVRHGPERKGDIPRSALDATRLRAATGWAPRLSLAEGLAQTWAWFRERPGA